MTELGGRILDEVAEQEDAMLAFLGDLVSLESPSYMPECQEPLLALLSGALEEIGYRTRRVRGVGTGGHLLARPRSYPAGQPFQLLLGHCDTVWNVGTLETMPLVRHGNHLRGPGVFDMKAGLAQIVFALRTLKRLGLEPPITPVVLVNSDEEIGSPDSRRLIGRLARTVIRTFLPEPALGPEGALKTARKGMSRYTIRVHGKAAHAGLDPTRGASAIAELAHLVQELHAMTDLDRGITVNVGVVSGGTQPNVIAAEAVAEVDVRMLSVADGEAVERQIRALEPSVPGTSLSISAGSRVPPLEATPRNRALWEQARRAARELDLTLVEAAAGGGSDGNTTSQFTATLDGLGAVGDGAHAAHEFVRVDKLLERCALLARLILLPSSHEGGRA